MIEGYIGRPGAGKTYSLTRRLLKIADSGRHVYSNYSIDHPNVTLFNPLEFADLPPGVIALDEAHLYFPARGALKLPMSWLTLMSQTRKRGWDIFYTTQHENRLDRVIRDITNVMWLSQCYAFGETPWLFAARGYEPEYFRKPKRVVGRWYGRFDKKVAAAYDTYETIQEAEHLKADDVYRVAQRKAAGNVQVRDGGSGFDFRGGSIPGNDRGDGLGARAEGHGRGAGLPGFGDGVLPWAEVFAGGGYSDGEREG